MQADVTRFLDEVLNQPDSDDPMRVRRLVFSTPVLKGQDVVLWGDAGAAILHERLACGYSPAKMISHVLHSIAQAKEDGFCGGFHHLRPHLDGLALQACRLAWGEPPRLTEHLSAYVLDISGEVKDPNIQNELRVLGLAMPLKSVNAELQSSCVQSLRQAFETGWAPDVSQGALFRAVEALPRRHPEAAALLFHYQLSRVADLSREPVVSPRARF